MNVDLKYWIYANFFCLGVWLCREICNRQSNVYLAGLSKREKNFLLAVRFIFGANFAAANPADCNLSSVHLTYLF